MNATCRNCQAELYGKFCSRCGQKVIDLNKRKVSHIAEEFFHYFTHLDSKFFKSLKNLLFRPGLITNDVVAGITAPHYKVSSLFLLATLLYFLIPNHYIISNNMVTPYAVEIKGEGIGAWKRGLALNKISGGHINEQQLAANFDKKKHAYGKLLTFLLIPLTMAVLWLVQFICRSFRKEPGLKAYDFGIASLEINSMILLVFFVFSGLLFAIFSLFAVELLSKVVVGVSLLLTIFLIYRFLSRVLRLNTWQSLIALVLFLAGYLTVMIIYGIITFILFI